MRIVVTTKRSYVMFSFREAADEDIEIVLDQGSFDPADELEHAEELRSTEFGFCPAVIRA